MNWCTRFCSYNNDARADADVCRLLHSIGCLLRQTGCHVHLVRPYTYSSGGNRGGNSRPHLSSSGRGYLRSRDRPLGAQDRHSFEVKPRGPEWQRPYFRCMICGTGLWQKSGSNRAARTFRASRSIASRISTLRIIGRYVYHLRARLMPTRPPVRRYMSKAFCGVIMI